MNFVLEGLDKVKAKFKKFFVSYDNIPKNVRIKHLRLGAFIACSLLLSCFLVLRNANLPKEIQTIKVVSSTTKKIDLDELAKGVSNENIWLEGAEKEIEAVKQNQQQSQEEQGRFKDFIDKDKVSKEELAEVIKKLEDELIQKNSVMMEAELGRLKAEDEKKALEASMEYRSFTKKIKRKKVGEYFPAGSYVKANITSGVDAGVGMTAEADPRQVLLRLTGEITSAGIGREYTTSNQLKGCTVLCKAVGDISSEKVYLNTVVLSCRQNNYYIEVPIKGFISSTGKAGIRGEVVSREGDMVLNSFLSGIMGGFGNGISQFSQPGMAMTSGGMFETTPQKAKNIATRGLGGGLSNSSDKLSEYFIKRAEQYQPVISVDEGTEVHIVLQEGFSFKEDEDDKSSK